MKPHCRISYVQAVNYVVINGGCIKEFKQYGYTECNTGVSVYWQKSTGIAVLFADSMSIITTSLEVWYERKIERKKTQATVQAIEELMDHYVGSNCGETTRRLFN